uniref:Subtilisin n=1 Tax=Pristionchus pacificus TaxID=54126 RepID=A0A8R1Z651_PRIPA
MKAQELWDMGLKGQGVRVGVFDTGLGETHPHFKTIIERTDWTNEKTPNDGLGHGTFVAGLISGTSEECPGFAPAASIHIYKVFTKKQVSYTSWFLDAFNHAIMRGINIINLSIGGPDFTDRPFMDKVWELSANGIILISAIGNDGPSFGTLNNPADQMDVIGVGGVNSEGRMARFSSRGMTIWELPDGYGRAKPDVVSYGASVLGSALDGGCRVLSGTSVASPVVSGAVALMLSGIEDRTLWNAGVVKQALIEGALRISDSAASIFEQGAGSVDLLRSFKFMRKYKPQVTLFPSHLDSLDCPYLWPFCADPLYAGALPKIVNVTIISGLSVSSRIEEPPVWEPFSTESANVLRISFSYSPQIWPWTGFMALFLSVNSEHSSYTGNVSGRIRLTVVSDHFGEKRRATIAFPMRLRIIPTPARSQRILWDQFRNLRYPPGYIPRDDLREKQNPLDWNGDHPHTNFRLFFQHLRADGFFLEILGEPLTCADLSQYSVYLVVDPEEEFFPHEIDLLENAVNKNGLNMIIFADWYNTKVMEKIKFFDENSKEWWTPETGGSNIPALNDLLSRWGLELADTIIEGNATIGDLHSSIKSGTVISRAPAGTHLSYATVNDITDEIISGDSTLHKSINAPVFALLRNNATGSGFVSIFSDSSCLESKSASFESCIPLVDILIDAAAYGVPHSFCDLLITIPSPLIPLFPPPLRSDLSKHFTVISSVVENFDHNKVTYRTLPSCRTLPLADPFVVENISYPGDISDRNHEAFARVVFSPRVSSINNQLKMENMMPKGGILLDSSFNSTPQPGLIYPFISVLAFFILFILLAKLCRWRILSKARILATRIL